MLDELNRVTRTISTRVVIDMESMQVVERDSYEYTGPLDWCAGVVGTGIQQPSAQLLNTLDAITQKYIYPTIGDQTFVPSPAFWGLTKRGKDIREGGEIVYPLVTAEATTGGAYYGDQLLDTTVVDTIQPANQVWRPYYQSVNIPVTDIILNRGGIFDLVKAKMETDGAASLLQKLSRAMWHTAPQNTTLDIDDLDSWVRLTSNTIAGINRSTSTFWQPAANVAGGGVALSPATFESAYQTVVFGYDEPDLALMDNIRFGAFKNNYTSLIRFTELEQDETALQAGFRYHFVVNNAVIMADRFTPAQRAYILNSKYIFPIFNANDYFKIDPWMQPSNQRVVVSKIYLMWQLACLSPRMNVAVTGLA